MPAAPFNMSYPVIFAAAREAGDRSMREAGRTYWGREDYQACWNELERLCPAGRDESFEGSSGSGLSLA
jgi:hypothetical protein